MSLQGQGRGARKPEADGAGVSFLLDVVVSSDREAEEHGENACGPLGVLRQWQEGRLTSSPVTPGGTLCNIQQCNVDKSRLTS